MDLLAEDGHEIQETTLTLDDVYNAHEAFLTGNYSKIQPVIKVGDATYQIGPVATRARELYFDFAKREGGKNLMEDQNQVGRESLERPQHGLGGDGREEPFHRRYPQPAADRAPADTTWRACPGHSFRHGRPRDQHRSHAGRRRVDHRVRSDTGMLNTARSRSENIGLSTIRFAAAEMEALPFLDNAFDCVTCRFGLMFPEDSVAAAGEVQRVLKPGGRVGYMVWALDDENPPFFVIRRAIARALGQEEGPVPHRHNPGARSAYRHSENRRSRTGGRTRNPLQAPGRRSQ